MKIKFKGYMKKSDSLDECIRDFWWSFFMGYNRFTRKRIKRR